MKSSVNTPLTAKQANILAAIERRLDAGESAPSYRELRDEFGWSSTGTVRDHLQALARKGYIELSGSSHRRVKLRRERPRISRIPVLGRVAAGLPTFAEENIEGHLPVPEEWKQRGAAFALRVNGDSMIDAGIRQGDYVVVRPRVSADSGDIVVAEMDGETTLKRFWRSGRRVVLKPENTRYKPIEVRTDSSAIQGVVVALLRDYGHGKRFGWLDPANEDSNSSRGRKRNA
jgi:repressor LexA